MNQFHPNRTNASGALFFGIAALLSSLMGDLMAALVLGPRGFSSGSSRGNTPRPTRAAGFLLQGSPCRPRGC